MLQDRLGATDRELARLIHGNVGRDPVVDDHREATTALAHIEGAAVDIQAKRRCIVAVAVSEHPDPAIHAQILAPGVHDVGVIDRHAGNRINALVGELAGISQVSRHMLCRTGGRKCTGNRKENNSFARKQLFGRYCRRPAFGYLSEDPVG